MKDDVRRWKTMNQDQSDVAAGETGPTGNVYGAGLTPKNQSNADSEIPAGTS